MATRKEKVKDIKVKYRHWLLCLYVCDSSSFSDGSELNPSCIHYLLLDVVDFISQLAKVHLAKLRCLQLVN